MIKQIIADVLFIETSEIQSDLFKEINDLDSLAFSIFLTRVESKYGISIEAQNLSCIESISSLALFVTKNS